MRKLENGLRDIATCRLNRNVTVLVKVNAHTLRQAVIRQTKQLTLQALVGWTNYMFAIFPHAAKVVATTTTTITKATAGSETAPAATAATTKFAVSATISAATAAKCGWQCRGTTTPTTRRSGRHARWLVTQVWRDVALLRRTFRRTS